MRVQHLICWFVISAAMLSLGIYLTYSATTISGTTDCLYLSLIDSHCQEETDGEGDVFYFHKVDVIVRIGNGTYPASTWDQCSNMGCTNCACSYTVGRTYTCWSDADYIFMSCGKETHYLARMAFGIGFILAAAVSWIVIFLFALYNMHRERDYTSL